MGLELGLRRADKPFRSGQNEEAAAEGELQTAILMTFCQA